MMTPILFIHIVGGSLAVIAGYAALFSPKGGWLHRRAGMVFVYAMIVMGAGAVVVGLSRGKSTWVGGPFVFYLVVTSMLTVRRGITPSRTRDVALMLLGLVMGIASVTGGIRGFMAPPGLTEGGVPIRSIAFMSLVNAFVLLLCVNGDIRVLRSGFPTGTRRLRRHLWRMCYAMFTATGSFFLGQPQAIPEPLRIKPLPMVLAFLPLPIMFYYLWRPRRRSKKIVAPLPTQAKPRNEMATDALEAMK